MQRGQNKQQNDVVELLPCPFCGGKAEIRKTVMKLSCVVCSKCFARTSVNVIEKAVKEWNSRFEPKEG